MLGTNPRGELVLVTAAPECPDQALLELTAISMWEIWDPPASS